MTKDEIKKLIIDLTVLESTTNGMFPSFKIALSDLERLDLLVGNIKEPEPPPPPPPSLDTMIKKKGNKRLPVGEIRPLANAYFGRLQSTGIKRFNSWQMSEYLKLPKTDTGTYLALEAKAGRIVLIAHGKKGEYPASYELPRNGEPSLHEASASIVA